MPETTIHLPKPCAESWAAMTPTPTGRHCASCQETVVDFTRMSEAEVVMFLRQHPSVSCGRFRNSQLDRPLRAPAQAVGGWRRWWGATLALLGLGALAGPQARGQAVSPAYWGGPVPAAAHNTPDPTPASAPTAPPLEQAGPVTNGTIADVLTNGLTAISSDSVLFSGIVRNPLGFRHAGARVWLRVDGHGLASATTDSRGQFTLRAPASALAGNAILRAMSPVAKESYYVYLKADVPVDVAHTRPYTIRMKRYKRIISSGKFR